MEISIKTSNKNKTIIFIVRFIHIILTIIMIFSLLYIYYSVVTDKLSYWLFLAIGILVGEGVTLYLTQGNCPLAKIHNKYGDNKGFWDLFLPKSIIPKLILALKIITLAGLFLVFLRLIT